MLDAGNCIKLYIGLQRDFLFITRSARKVLFTKHFLSVRPKGVDTFYAQP